MAFECFDKYCDPKCLDNCLIKEDRDVDECIRMCCDKKVHECLKKVGTVV